MEISNKLKSLDISRISKKIPRNVNFNAIKSTIQDFMKIYYTKKLLYRVRYISDFHP